MPAPSRTGDRVRKASPMLNANHLGMRLIAVTSRRQFDMLLICGIVQAVALISMKVEIAAARTMDSSMTTSFPLRLAGQIRSRTSDYFAGTTTRFILIGCLDKRRLAGVLLNLRTLERSASALLAACNCRGRDPCHAIEGEAWDMAPPREISEKSLSKWPIHGGGPQASLLRWAVLDGSTLAKVLLVDFKCARRECPLAQRVPRNA
jgi:hypothetical protein